MICKVDSLAQKLEKIVDNAIDEFVCKDRVLLQRNLSERALCGALMKRLYDVLGSKGNEEFKDYFVDVEFNRRYANKNNAVKELLDIPKTIMVSNAKKTNYS